MPDDTFRWVIAGGVAIATLSIVAMAFMMVTLLRILGRVQAKVENVANQAVPLAESVRFLIGENSPKIGNIITSVQETAGNARDISINARDISVIAKDQAQCFADLGRDVADRAKVQVARVDAVVDETIDQVENLGANVKSAVMKPVGEMSGILAGIRAGVVSYTNGRRPDVARVTQDEEMFI